MPRKRTRFAAALLSTAAASTLYSATPAQADQIVYVSDQCYESEYCFALYYEDDEDSFGDLHGSCFITNRTEYSHEGRGVVQGTEVLTYRYMFRDNRWQNPRGNERCELPFGAGSGVKNNAEAAFNADHRTHRVYYNTGWGGINQSFPTDFGRDLISDLRNDNASSRRLT